MIEFIRRSPLIFVSTLDGKGQVDVSPKGDSPGFVQFDGAGKLLIEQEIEAEVEENYRDELD